MSCRKSKIIFQDHNIPLSWENVEIRGFEPPDLLHATQGRAVAGWGRASACERFTCGNPGPMWPDVARRLPTLAPNLAPRKLVSSANVRQGPNRLPARLRGPGNTPHPRSVDSLLRY